jgi:hypothetical protein
VRNGPDGVLDGLSYYHTGHSLHDSSVRLRERYGISDTPTALSTWIKESYLIVFVTRGRE